MCDIEQDPIGWLSKLCTGLFTLCVIQLIAGTCTIFIIQSNVPPHTKHPLCLSIILLLALISSWIFDPRTHLIGTVVGAVTMTFTTPLNAIAVVDNSDLIKSDVREVILRIAVPTAKPSHRNPSEDPLKQLLRGVMYIGTLACISPQLLVAVQQSGVVRDAAGLAFVLFGSSGVLNIMAACLALFGIRSASPFRNPMFSKTMSSFWSGRWNATVSDALRVGVYEPLRKRGFSKPICSLACFLVSGVAHEVVLIYCGILDSKGEWMMFFFLSGVAVLVERRFISQTHKLVQHLTTICVLYALFHYLFVPVTIRTGLAQNGVQSIGAGVKLARALGQWMST